MKSIDCIIESNLQHLTCKHIHQELIHELLGNETAIVKLSKHACLITDASARIHLEQQSHEKQFWQTEAERRKKIFSRMNCLKTSFG